MFIIQQVQMQMEAATTASDGLPSAFSPTLAPFLPSLKSIQNRGDGGFCC